MIRKTVRDHNEDVGYHELTEHSYPVFVKCKTGDSLRIEACDHAGLVLRQFGRRLPRMG